MVTATVSDNTHLTVSLLAAGSCLVDLLQAEWGIRDPRSFTCLEATPIEGWHRRYQPIIQEVVVVVLMVNAVITNISSKNIIDCFLTSLNFLKDFQQNIL